MEEWRVCTRHPNYEASSEGKVRKTTTKRLLKPTIQDRTRDYEVVCLYTNGKKYSRRLGRLIWETFNDVPCGASIDHIDRNAKNNRIENLRCVTSKENSCNRDNYSNKTNKYSLTDDDKRIIINKLKSREWTSWTVMKEYKIPTNYTHMVVKRGTWDKFIDEQSTISTIQKDSD